MGKTGLGLDSAEREHVGEGAAAVCAAQFRYIEGNKNANVADTLDMAPIHFLEAILGSILTPS